jgi:hypothetical protein
MAAKTYRSQLDEAKEAMQLIVAGQLQSHSTLAGTYQHFTLPDLREHISWLEDMATREESVSSGNRAGRRYCAVAMSGSIGRNDG